MRMRSVSGCLQTTRSRRNAAAYLSAAPVERPTRPDVEPPTAAALTMLGLRRHTLHGGRIRDPIKGLSRIVRVSLLHDTQCLLTPFLDRAASQQQKQHPDHRHHE